jgi:FAD/FMN-containing dehydrogenase
MAIAHRSGDLLFDSTLAAFSRRLNGRLILAADADYDAARSVHNAAIDRRPAAIVRPADEGDVIRSVNLARDAGLPLAVRGGGHSMAGHGTVDGGLVIDLSRMRGLTIDGDARVAWAQGGLTAGEYTTRAAQYGLATPFGDTASVGIGGITLGGGIGYLVRKYGLTVDNVVSVELVTADGRLITASEDQHADLFWAVRGGGGNFGVVTSFQYRLHPVDTVYGGALFQPPTADVIGGYAQAATAAGDDLSTIALIMPAPPAPFVPAEAQGKPAFVTLAVHSGPVEGGEAQFAPFRALARPIVDLLGPMPYPAIYAFTEAAQAPTMEHVRSTYLASIDDDVVRTVLGFMGQATSPRAMVQLRVLGGAMARVPSDATAFAHRGAGAMLTIITPYDDPSESEVHRAWTMAFLDALRPKATGTYVNFLEDEGEARIREAYPGATYERLAAVKAAYDPTNVFSLNQNVRPAL